MSDPTEDTPDPAGRTGERVAKLIARTGVCSRRAAERLVAEGRVTLDGEPITDPATRVDDPARLAADGVTLPAQPPTRLFRYHKPRGRVVAAHDPHGRPTIYDDLPAEMPRVMPVGRLDVASEGLLLLTNDGELKRRLEHPETGWTRRYRARVHGTVDEKALASLENGITIDGVTYGAIRATFDRRTGANAWLSVSLREGKNREVRRVLDHLGMRVNRLMRVAYGPFQLGQLKKGHASEVAPKVLREQLGIDAPGERPTGRAKAKPKKRKPRDAHRRRTA
ncbi:23S rRNA pseudouridine2605 synthase [Limimonas halophila]|uniref:Pseudouridine synthase n=1 Tax=Limimonas halophila TaxID=1082479 RepID=A0A1G7UQ18_9PROT|nr:pseudouridine synthase [Limimonas halophila]SDG49695.1 23S rRNA pseudouridine2605 synthase [Limimonas halophila]